MIRDLLEKLIYNGYKIFDLYLSFPSFITSRQLIEIFSWTLSPIEVADDLVTHWESSVVKSDFYTEL